MENMEENLNEFAKKNIESIKQTAKDEAETVKALQTEAHFVNYFKQFDDYSVETFISHYKWLKPLLLTHGKQWTEIEEEKRFNWINKAHYHLTCIQQKKLFDIQCQWRAAQIEIPGVNICFDFEIWSNNVLNCPFIEPISQHDIDLYTAFLQDNDSSFEERDFQALEWQNYEDIKLGHETEQEEGNYIDWYNYHNDFTGNAALLSLPDIKGEKERYYRNLYFDHKNQTKKKPINSTPEIIKPSMGSPYDYQVMRQFIATFENKELLKAYDIYHQDMESEELERLQAIVETLFTCGETISLEANKDWKEALINAEHRYHAQQIIAHLPIAYETYVLNNTLQIAHAHDEKQNLFLNELRKDYVTSILTGRELCGEPRDFNY